MARIVLIEPRPPNLHIFSKFYTPRLGSFILGTLMRDRGWQVEVIIEELEPIDFEAIRHADLVGISTITSTAPRAYAIADRLRSLGVKVMMGGPHVTFLSEEALAHADFVIRGEGENALAAFAEAWEKGGGLENVPNLSYWRDGVMRHNPIQAHVEDLDAIPFPDLSLSKAFGRMRQGKVVIPVQTSRGCPFACSFCSVTGMFGRKYRFRSTASVMNELRRYDPRRHFIFFYDDNFTADAGRAKDLLRAMIAAKFKFQWSTQVRADVTRDPELVRLMKKAGCQIVFIGFESVNPQSLKAMKKGQTVAEIARAVKVLRRRRIRIHGMFVFGFDEDDWRTVRRTVRFAKRARLTSSQFMILTPLPGSDFYDRICAQQRIRFHDWNLYDAHHVVFDPTRLAPLDLQRAQIYCHKKFYSLAASLRKLLNCKWVDLAIAHYARRLNRQWLKINRTYLTVLSLLRPRRKNQHVIVDYREEATLDPLS
ncbi:MAG: radical SAM protein [Candidatus Aminicenantes bacterium]|nr:radical SAM protein [Candidatus Aminicenantes bacterium]